MRGLETLLHSLEDKPAARRVAAAVCAGYSFECSCAEEHILPRDAMEQIVTAAYEKGVKENETL